MGQKRYVVALSDYEHSVLIGCLNDKKTGLMAHGKATDAVDELIIKIGKAPLKRQKTERGNDDAR